jgi:hypothetical protein
MAIEISVTCGARRFAWAGLGSSVQRPWGLVVADGIGLDIKLEGPQAGFRRSSPAVFGPLAGREQLRVCPEEGLAEPSPCQGCVQC